jgi:ABC-type taurine transport system substrate-binding protein
MFNLITRKEIRKPGDLQGEKIGVASLAGTNAFAIRLVLKEWKIPTEAVYLLVIGGSPTRRFRAISVKRDRKIRTAQNGVLE